MINASMNLIENLIVGTEFRLVTTGPFFKEISRLQAGGFIKWGRGQIPVTSASYHS